MDSRLLEYINSNSVGEILKMDLDNIIYSELDLEYFKNINILPIDIDDNHIICISNIDVELNTLSDIRLKTLLYPKLLKVNKTVYDEIYNKLNLKDNTNSKKLTIFQIDNEETEGNLGNLRRVVNYLNLLIEKAIERKASDIHIDPLSDCIRIRFRIDGKLEEAVTLNVKLLPIIVTRIKILGNMDIAEKRIPQDGRISFQFDGREIDMRISTLPTIHGEKIVVRLLDNVNMTSDLSRLGLEGRNLNVVEKFINEPYGLILFCGPTGVGKSSSIYTLLEILNQDEVNIISIEDPVEYRVNGVNQIQVHYKIGLTFEKLLMNVLRSDPDIISIGELRNEETAEVAMRAAITGHLILSTLHTSNAIGGIFRLLDLKIEKYMITNGLIGVVSQRLVRKLCPYCKRREYGFVDFLNCEVEYYEPNGCEKCNAGYYGRTGIFEVLKLNQEIVDLILGKCKFSEIYDAAIKSGFIPIIEQAKKLFTSGNISKSEVEKVISSFSR